MEFRVRRTVLVARPMDKVMAGRIRYLNPPEPDGGSHLSTTANKYISNRPNQKVGMERPVIVSAVSRLSSHEFLLTAAMIPTIIASGMATSIESPTSSSVCGSASPIISITGRLYR